MADTNKSLGKLVAIHGIAPAYLQRAVFVVILSFVFFLTTMAVYYVRQNIMYFMLASAFLVIYLVTLFSFMMQRRSVVQVYEGGLNFKKRSVSWNEIAEVSNKGAISLSGGRPILLPKTLNNFDSLIRHIQQKTAVK